jgi:alpha-beta hydrolase superfamily lysophospholipase
MEMEIECPILSKINETNPIYKQKILRIANNDIIVTTAFRGNRRCIVYIPGYDDHWYLHHVFEEYPHLDFISIDIPGFGFNKNRYFDNHLENMQLICHFISEATRQCCAHEIVDCLGFSLGGHISLYYTWTSEFNKRLFKFNKLLLVSPLVNIYCDSTLALYLGIFVSRVTYAFTNKLNVRYDAGEYEYRDYPELKNIYESEKLKKYNVTDFNIYKIGGKFSKPISNGTVVTILNNINEIKKGYKIQTPVICVCSSSYGPNELTQDNVCHHQDITDYLDEICRNHVIHKFKCGHHPLRQPFFTDVSFVDICNKLFEVS